MLSIDNGPCPTIVVELPGSIDTLGTLLDLCQPLAVPLRPRSFSHHAPDPLILGLCTTGRRHVDVLLCRNHTRQKLCFLVLS